MNSSNRFILAAVLALSAGLALAQETAGRVIAAVGDVTIDREGKRLPATVGSPVMTGDQLVLGVQSNAQIRLTDQSIIALRPETVFKLTEYAFQGQPPERQRSAFELVKGGMRTVTGLIGRALNRPEAYSVVTPTATIGIRGTHYSLVHCDGGCRGPGGAVAPNGTYGAVTDGRIAVANRAGERVFGADQYFQVASRDASPQPLIAPPPFLRDRLEGRARARDRQQESQQARAQGGTGGQQGQASQGSQGSASAATATPATATATTTRTGSESATTVAQTGLGATTGDTGLSGLVSSPTPVVLPTTTLVNTFVSNETLTSGGLASTIQPGLSGTVFYRLAGPFSIPVSCATPPCDSINRGDIILGVNYALQRAYVRLAIGTSGTTIVNAGTPLNSDGIPITVSGGSVNFGITLNRADYPNQQGAFRCFGCGSGTTATLSYLSSMSVSGTISGGIASLTFTGVDSDGAHTFQASLSQVAPPNTDAAAAVVPRSGGGADTLAGAYWDASVDAQRRLTAIGPSVGGPQASAGSANNVLVGAAPAVGNLAWGYWSGSGGQITDGSYQTSTTNSSTIVPWITGTATNTLPVTLGSTSYMMIGGSVNGGQGTLNSASLSADFVNRTMAISLNASNTSAGTTFQMAGSSGISAINGRFSAGFSSVTCSGSCGTGTPSGSFGGFFAGSQAEGAGVAFTAGYGTGNGVNGVAAFKR